jgi:hypothetical protein
MMVSTITRPAMTKIGTPVEVGTIKQTSKAVNTDYFATNLSPQANAGPVLHRIQIRLATGSIVKVEMDDGTNTNIEYDLNGGTALGAGQVFIFDIVVPQGYSYNIQHETGTQLVDCQVMELQQLTG